MTVRQAGQMPSPVVLKVQFAAPGNRSRSKTRADGRTRRSDRRRLTAILTWPVDVWFNGNRTFEATLDFGGRADQHDHARPELPLPGSDTGGQRVAEAGGGKRAETLRVDQELQGGGGRGKEYRSTIRGHRSHGEPRGKWHACEHWQSRIESHFHVKIFRQEVFIRLPRTSVCSVPLRGPRVRGLRS